MQRNAGIADAGNEEGGGDNLTLLSNILLSAAVVGDLATLRSVLNDSDSPNEGQYHHHQFGPIDVDEYEGWANGYKLLHVAARFMEIDVASYLLQEKGAAVDVRDLQGDTPFLLAVEQGHSRMALYLWREHGANIFATNYNLQTALHLSCFDHVSTTLVTFLLDHGLSVTNKDVAGRTPYYLACCAGNAPQHILERMLKMGANPYEHDAANGWTILHAVASSHHGYDRLLDMLLQYNEDPVNERCTRRIRRGVNMVNARDREGYTPLHVASCVSHASVLIENGADLEAKNQAGETPGQVARRRGKHQVSDYVQLAIAFSQRRDTFLSNLVGVQNEVESENGKVTAAREGHCVRGQSKFIAKGLSRLLRESSREGLAVIFFCLRKTFLHLTTSKQTGLPREQETL